MKKCPDLTNQTSLYRDTCKEFAHLMKNPDFKAALASFTSPLEHLGFLISRRILLHWAALRVIEDYTKRLCYAEFEAFIKGRRENGVHKEARYLYFLIRQRSHLHGIQPMDNFADDLNTHMGKYFHQFVMEVHWGKPNQGVPDALLRIHDDQPYQRDRDEEEPIATAA